MFARSCLAAERVALLSRLHNVVIRFLPEPRTCGGAGRRHLTLTLLEIWLLHATKTPESTIERGSQRAFSLLAIVPTRELMRCTCKICRGNGDIHRWRRFAIDIYLRQNTQCLDGMEASLADHASFSSLGSEKSDAGHLPNFNT